jgi:ribosome-binding factor A
VKKNRLSRINSLLKEVIFEVIQKEVRNPHINTFITVTEVETSADLHHAKVSISLIATDAEKAKILAAVQSAAGFIAVNAAKKVRLRYFPSLTFKLDNSADELIRIQNILADLEKERMSRAPQDDERNPAG